MGFNVNSPAGIFAGLDALNLDTASWSASSIAGQPAPTLLDYSHGMESLVLWLQFTVQDLTGVITVVRGSWDLFADTPSVSIGPTEAELVEQLTAPFNGKPFIDPGIDGLNGSDVWFRYGVPGVVNTTQEYRFSTPLNVNLGNLGKIISAMGIQI